MITNYSDELPLVTVAPQDLGQVVLKMFYNAFYATQQKAKTKGADYKPSVEVGTGVKDSQVEINIKDNGTGIPDAIKDKIMQQFLPLSQLARARAWGYL